MIVNDINEKIKVAAVFDGHRVVPKWFFWDCLRHEIVRIEHTWRGKEGETPLLFFSVTDGANVYEIRLDQRKLEWVLEKVYMEG